MPPLTRLLPAPHDRDRGSAPLQVAILFPVVILLIFAIVQAFTIAWAHNAVATAAREGVAAGRMYEAQPGDGAAKASQAAADLGGNLLTGVHVSTAGSNRERMTLRVEGQAVSLIPGLSGITVTSTASGPVERWTTPGGN